MSNQETDSSTSAKKRETVDEEISIFSAGSLGGDASGRRAGEGAVDLRIAVEKNGRLDPFLDKTSDQFSSILVKETRQATKSRHFVWTFFATIIITLVVTFVALSDGSGSNKLGQVLLMGYLVVLGLPLMIIVPMSTFQSLSAEHGDGTLQLISITTMKPSEIVMGKLCSAFLQILIYMSVLAPCVTFTFLLRGVDVYQIIFSLLSAFGCSASLCCLGLAMGSISTTRMVSAGLQLVFVLILLAGAWMWCFISYGFAQEFGGLPKEAYFWIAGWACGVLSTALLLLVAATAQITFDSDNRATYLRIAMLVQQTLFVAFLIGVSGVDGSLNGVMILLLFFLHYWLFMGSLLTMTSHRLSNRVQRSMPKTIWGQCFGGLLMPGPGRGFLFAWSNGIFGATVAAVLMFLISGGKLNYEAVFLSFCYFSLFLSCCYIFNSFVKRFSPHASIWIGLLGLGIVMFLPSIFVAIFEAFDYRREYFDAGFLAYANWYSALDRTVPTTAWDLTSTKSAAEWMGYGAMILTALITTAYALLSSCREFSVRSIATPDHVLAEDRDHARRDPLGRKEESIDDIFD
jgi:hypothetical protein